MPPPGRPGLSPAPAALPPPRPINGNGNGKDKGKGGSGGGAEGPVLKGSLPQARSVKGTGTIVNPPGPSAISGSRTSGLPTPRQAHQSASGPVIDVPADGSGGRFNDHHRSARAAPAYYATADIVTYHDDGSIKQVVARQGQLLFPDVIDEGLIIVDGEALTSEQYRIGGAS